MILDDKLPFSSWMTHVCIRWHSVIKESFYAILNDKIVIEDGVSDIWGYMIDTKVSEVYEQTIKLEELEAEPEQAPAHNNKQTVDFFRHQPTTINKQTKSWFFQIPAHNNKQTNT